MSELSPNQRLDHVLNYLKSTRSKVYYPDLIDKMKKDGLITSQYDLQPLLVKLEKDNYIHRIKESSYEDAFIIYPDGELFMDMKRHPSS